MSVQPAAAQHYQPIVIEVSANEARDTLPAGIEIPIVLRDKPLPDGSPGPERTILFAPPDINVLVILLARVEASSSLQMAGTMINTFFSMIPSEEDVRWLTKRLFDPKDDFSASTIAKILVQTVEGWSGNPTESSPGSSGSQRRSGKHSRKKHSGRASTPGTSTSASGASSSTVSPVDA